MMDRQKDVGETFAELGNLVVHSKRDVTHVTPLCSCMNMVKVDRRGDYLLGHDNMASLSQF